MSSVEDLAHFIYVDSAVGGEERRNHVRDIRTFHPPIGAVGTYVTLYRYDRGLVDHWSNTKNQNGNRSVTGYRGPALATFAPFDIDHEGPDGPTVALTDARRLFEWLADRWDIPEEAIRVIYSGSKGFHEEIPSTLFGSFEPSIDTPERLRRLALALIDDLGFAFDLSIFNHLRLWRVPNSLHQKTRRYAIPLTPSELRTLDASAIAELASQPRPEPWLPDDEWTARTDLVDLWRATATVRTTSAKGIQADSPLLCRVPSGSGKRHAALVSLAGTLRHRGLDAETIGDMLLAYSNREFEEPAPESDIRAIARSVAAYSIDEVPSDRLLAAVTRRKGTWDRRSTLALPTPIGPVNLSDPMPPIGVPLDELVASLAR